jgi:hypothetical protein
MLSHRQSERRAGFLALLTFVALGCAPEGPAAPAGIQSLSDAEARLVGREVAGEVEDVAGSFTFVGLLWPSFPSAGIAATSGIQPAPMANCPTITPNPPLDTDGDRVPDDVTLSFTLPDCSLTRNGATSEITGSIHITDPSATDFGIRAVFTDLQHKLTQASGAFFLSRLNGPRQALRSGGGAGFSLMDSTTADRESSEHGAAQLAKAWVLSFVADAGQTVTQERGLPGGDLSVEGRTTWTRQDVSHSFSVATVTPLHHDATCATRPAFTSGELTVVKTGPDGTVTIHVVFNGCGVEPTVTVERSAA